MTDTKPEFTPAEIKMRQAFGGAQDFHDILAQFASKHRLCDLIIIGEDFNSPLAAVYWFRPVKEFIGHGEAVAMLNDGLLHESANSGEVEK